MKTILVTGGSGFIGANFINYLFCKKEFNCMIVNVDKLTYAGNPENLTAVSDEHLNQRYFFEKVDIVNQLELEKIFVKYHPDIVVHFAAESHVDRSILGPKEFIETNIIGTFNLLECSRKYWDNFENKLFHHVSTDEVYGSLTDEGFFYENTPYDPHSPYSASKASSDHLVNSYFHTYGLPVTISNCSNNYGPNHFPEKLIPLAINNIKNMKPIPIYGKGENIRDWLYVIDHARAIDVIFHSGKDGETYNIGGNNEWTNIALIHKLCEVMDGKLNREAGTSASLITFVKDRAGHDMRYAIDSTKLQTKLGWAPSLQFEEGIELTVDWYLENEEWLNNVVSGDYAKYYKEMYKG